MSLDIQAFPVGPSVRALPPSDGVAWLPDPLPPIDVPVEMSKILQSIVVWAIELLDAGARHAGTVAAPQPLLGPPRVVVY